MTDILDATATAIYTTLAAGTALTSLLATTTSIYDRQPPDEAALDYVVFYHYGGGPTNITSANYENNLWFVGSYSKTTAKTATAIRAAADALLHKKTLTITGGRCIWCHRETNIQLVETQPNGQKAWMSGAIYRIETTGI